MTTLRLATANDLVAINAIYNHYVTTSTATYQTVPSTDAERATWFVAHGERHPVIVAEIDGVVVGWGSLSPFHTRAAFARTVEDSLYIHPDFHRRGLGRALLTELIKRGRALGHHVIIAAISGDQQPSIALHQQFGFTDGGRLHEVGHKFGRWMDLVYLQLVL
jgi:phosphinothricin acetyltransferase